MAGGNWITQNKVRPGVYVNITSNPKTLGTMGVRGTTALALSLPWGAERALQTVRPGDDVEAVFGYELNAPALMPLREALKRAGEVKVYRLNAAEKAKTAGSGLEIVAAYSGTRGNDLKVVIEQSVEDPSRFEVNTLLEGRQVDSQSVAEAAELKGNGWVTFAANGTDGLKPTAGMPLAGGTNGTVTNQDHSNFLAALEVEEFQTVGLLSDDPQLKALYTAYVKRLRETEGKKVQAVIPNYPSADDEGVISVKNGVILNDGTVIDKVQAVAWVAAATAAAEVNESLTYQAYDDAVDADVRFTHTQTTAALQNGELLFTFSGGKAIVEQDINSYTSFTPEKGRAFAKNRVIRVLDGIAGDMKSIFERYYVGKVANNEDGRALFWSECASYLDNLQQLGAIERFNAQEDLTVSSGEEEDSVLLELAVKPVDSVEKVYMKVKVV